MHVFFSGIGGTGIGPLALIAKQAGYGVSGSDIKDSQYIKYLREKGLEGIYVGQTSEQIAAVHTQKPIDWFVYSSALPLDNPNHPELAFCQQNNIRTSKRDEFLNEILSQKKMKLIAIAGTHGKTTTTAMVIWLFKQLGLPISYSVGAKINFGDMGTFDPSSEYFVYEADEFDHNFLAFYPYLSIITGVAWDHHEIFPTQEEYYKAFLDFIGQSQHTLLWREDFGRLELTYADKYEVEDYDNPTIEQISLPGLFNHRDAWLAVRAMTQITQTSKEQLIGFMNGFPGVSRRFEKLLDNLYTDYAHTPEKIIGAMSVAKEIAAANGQKIVVVYEPLTNRRMHYTAANHHSVFEGASAIYWTPSYLAREDPGQVILSPAELIPNLSPQLQQIAHPAELNEALAQAIGRHLQAGDLVVAMSGGSGGSLDEWLRQNFSSK